MGGKKGKKNNNKDNTSNKDNTGKDKDNTSNKDNNNNQPTKPQQEFKFDFGGQQSGQEVKFDFLGPPDKEKDEDEKKGKGGRPSIFDFAGKDAGLVPLLQQRLSTMVGKSSGYYEALPKQVQRRVSALKKLQDKKDELEDAYEKEISALEEKYRKLYLPLYEKRASFVTGEAEPTDEEVGVEEEKEESKKEESKKEESKSEVPSETTTKSETKQQTKEKEEPKETIFKKDVKGVPEFWLQALKHHDDFSELITPRDEDALRYLLDVKTRPLTEEAANPSFVLEFHFAENPYFEDKILMKTYHLAKHELFGDIMFDRVEATEIRWKGDKNLTVKKVTKQQNQGKRRGRRGGKFQPSGKPVIVEEPCMSFFNFFSPSALFGPMEDSEELDDEDKESLLEADYELGISVREQVIPNAVLWYTGEIVEAVEGEEGEEDDDDDEEGEEDEDDDVDSEEDADFSPNTQKQAPAGQEQCKQQ